MLEKTLDAEREQELQKRARRNPPISKKGVEPSGNEMKDIEGGELVGEVEAVVESGVDGGGNAEVS